RAAQLARLGARAAGGAARGGAVAAGGGARGAGRVAADRGRPARSDPRPAGGAPRARRGTARLDAGDAAGDPARRPPGTGGDRGVEPRAVHPRAARRGGGGVAHGSGSADRDVVDAQDRIAVPPPPERPAYRLRRVWLSAEAEAGYYYGFANEGLWPLCHIAHVRPIFRTADWEQYVKVNRTFTRAVLDESQSPDPIVLVQDFHLALLPRMIREALAGATIIAFWHIPWPNPEAFGICPWREELLEGLLGANILGFHTQFHCNNFVD